MVLFMESGSMGIGTRFSKLKKYLEENSFGPGNMIRSISLYTIFNPDV